MKALNKLAFFLFSVLLLLVSNNSNNVVSAHGHGHSHSHSHQKSADNQLSEALEFWESFVLYEKVLAQTIPKNPKLSEFLESIHNSKCLDEDDCPVYAAAVSVLQDTTLTSSDVADKLIVLMSDPFVKKSLDDKISKHKATAHVHHGSDHAHSNSKFKELANYLQQTIFSPNNPAASAILATFYISLFPNLVLLIIPSDLDPKTLRLMVSFAIGGLLGDVFLHLMPHIFSLPESISPEDAPIRSAHDTDLVESKSQKDSNGKTSAPKQNIQYSAYMNLISDATHNFTDGLALSASFYISPAAGLSTFIAVFLHEIPHELGDFAILVQSGFSQLEALMSQFFTAIGAMLGSFVGVLIEEAARGNSLNLSNLLLLNGPIFTPSSASTVSPSSTSKDTVVSHVLGSICSVWSKATSFIPSTVGGGVTWSELVIPFTAGGFLYIATVSVIPGLLDPYSPDSPEDQPSYFKKFFQLILEVSFMVLGVSLMAVIAMNE
ncbi:hypothetical protein BB560_001255 [Smittium megazygosporum]|uniref:Uncharacterized protein n=1 Tax=Smittium megazygosporum TaxID=133381 RepID=A0A2T9ZI35_9FUNG|nr:hypothetical protein BB560_001255 [Smittium megazygosporum]